MSDWTPDPQEKGWREPPRRNPPTAIGVATPPPPNGPRRGYARRSRFERFARSVVIAVRRLFEYAWRLRSA